MTRLLPVRKNALQKVEDDDYGGGRTKLRILLIIVAAIVAFSQTLRETRNLGSINTSLASWWEKKNNNVNTTNTSNTTNNDALLWRDSKRTIEERLSSLSSYLSSLTATTTNSTLTTISSSSSSSSSTGNSITNNDNNKIPSPLDMYYKERLNHYYAKVCSNVSTLPIKEGYFPEFCIYCSFDAGVNCLSKTVYWSQQYNISAKEATLGVVKSKPEQCCELVHDRRAVSLEEIPGKTPAIIADAADAPSSLQQDTTTTTTAAPITAWCVLGPENIPPPDWLGGMSHSSQALIPCWSYYQRVKQQLAGGREVKCGIWFQSAIDKVMKNHYTGHSGIREGWVTDLMGRMNCTYVFQMDYPELASGPSGIDTLPPPPIAASSQPQYQYRPTIPHWGEFNQFFQHPTDATSLQKQLGLTTIRPAKQPFKIGIVQRKGNARHITNIGEIQSQIQQFYPSAKIEYAEMEGKSFWEQATFWNRQDIVVVAHGAAVTNAMFMRKGTAIVEIFPLHYYVMMYRELCVSAGVYWFGWTHNQQFLMWDFDKHLSKRNVRWAARGSPLNPPIDKIMDLIHQAINITTQAQGLDRQSL